MGTPAYLSPEQARGEKVDGRSDVFAFGCVLHEMLGGRPAFGRGTAADTMVAILRDEPAPIGGSVPPPVEAIVRRCLRKNATERFASAGELAGALREARRESAASAESTERRRSIAVLPFKSLGGGGDADLGVALADATITELALVHSLLVRPTAAILRYRDRPADPEEAARELGVDAVVDGSVQSSGARLRVTVQLVDAAGGPLWGTKIDASLGDVFAMQDEVSRKIVEALRVRLSPSDERRLAAAAAPAPAAHELYLKGRIHLFAETRLDEVNAAIACFEEARRLDPGSALAMIGLADAWARMAFAFDPDGGWWERAEQLTEKALAIAPDLPEGRYLRGRMLWSPQRGFDHAGAMREFAGAIAGRPNLNEAHHFLAMVLSHVGLLDEARLAFERALAIYPGDEFTALHLGMVRLLQGRFDEGREITGATLSRPASGWTFYQLAQCELRLGRTTEAAETLERLSREHPDSVLTLGLRAVLAAVAGDAARARAVAALVVRNRRSYGHYHHAQYDLACIHALLGEPREAVALLQAAAADGFPCLPFFEADPLLEAARRSAEWAPLRKELSARQADYETLYRALRAGSGGASGSE
jgi:TolB-like protein